MSAESDSVGDYYTYGQYGIVTQTRHMIVETQAYGPNYGNICMGRSYYHVLFILFIYITVLNHRGVTILLCVVTCYSK